MAKRRRRKRYRPKRPLDEMEKPSYNSDTRSKVLRNLARHAKGLAHAAEELASLSEADTSGSDPNKGPSHPQDTLGKGTEPPQKE